MSINERLYGELEARLRVVEHEVQRLRDWRHDLPTQLVVPIQDELVAMRSLIETGLRDLKAVPVVGPSGENRHLTMRDFWIAVGGVSIGIAIAAKFFHP